MFFITVTAAVLAVIGIAWFLTIVYLPGPRGSGTVHNAMALPGIVMVGLSILLTILNGFVAVLS